MAALTSQECAVARLTAAGHSAAAIAKELSVSVRTVDNVLYAVYAKCGVSSETELARVLDHWTV
ncbi:MAG: hypothetical protein NVSMB19_18460 [Vulcanimicrobiaceae bacterium]